MRANRVLLGACLAQGALGTFNNSSPVTSAPLSFSSSFTSHCIPNCSLHYPATQQFVWVRLPSSAVVVATVVLGVNNATNVTRSSTIYNTDYEDQSPGSTNEAGTQISSFLGSDPVAHTDWSTTVAYPTPFFDYEYSWFVTGTYLTTQASGVTQCVTATTQSQATLPSHPAISYTCTANTPDADPYGEFYRFQSDMEIDDNWTCHSSSSMTDTGWFSDLFPDVSLPGDCQVNLNKPAEALTLVHSLTATITTYHSSSAPALTALSPSPQSTTLLLAPASSSTVSSKPGSSEKATSSPSFDKSGKQDPTPTIAIAAPVSQDPSTGSGTVVFQSTLNPTVTPLMSPALPKSVLSNIRLSTLSAPPLLLPVDSTFIGAKSNSDPSPPSLAASSIVKVGSQPITAISASEYIIGSHTLFPGSAITISSTVISLATGGLSLSIESSMMPLTVPMPISGPSPTITLPPFTTNTASELIFQTQTLTPGGSAITVSGKTLSFASSAEYIVEDTHTINLNPASTGQAPPAISFAGSTYTANAASEFVFQTQTLTPGGPAITVSSAILSLASDAGYILEDTHTINLKPTLTDQAPPFIVVAGSTFTANAASEFVFQTETLTPGGPPITVSGAKLSLASNAGYIVEGTSTINLAPFLTGSATAVSGTVTGSSSSVGMKGTDVVDAASASTTGLGAQIAQPFTGGAAVSRGMCSPVEVIGRAACVVWWIIGALVLYVY